MRNPTRILAASLALALSAMAVPTARAVQNTGAGQQTAAQQSVGALERGYRTGYSDGYQSGYGDSASRAPRDYKNKDEYQRADRAYSSSYGPLEDYRDGYQQGFEAGYDGGYERRAFDSTIPANIQRRGTYDPQNDPSSSSTSTGGGVSVSTSGGGVTGGATTGNSNVITFIPADTALRVELLTNLSTDVTQRGDTFQARVIEPAEFQDAMVQGHVSRVKRPGKVKGSSELQLSFDQISMNGRWTALKAQLVDVEDTGSSEGVGEVDEEGGVKGKSKTKDDIAKVGATTGVGAILGAILGGGKGAAIGAAIGGAVGAGSVLTSSGKDIRLERGQRMTIRTSTETRF